MNFNGTVSPYMEKQAGAGRAVFGGLFRYGLGGKHWANLVNNKSWLGKQMNNLMRDNIKWEKKVMKNGDTWIGGGAPILGGLGLHGLGVLGMHNSEEGSKLYDLGKNIKNISSTALGPWMALPWMGRVGVMGAEEGATQIVNEAANKVKNWWLIGPWLAKKIRKRGQDAINERFKYLRYI